MSTTPDTRPLPPGAAPVPAAPASRLWKVARALLVIVLLLAAGGAYLWRFEQPHHSTPKTLPAAIRPTGNRVLDALGRGVEFLRIHQEPDGHFSKGLLDPKPAFTALVVLALAQSRGPLSLGQAHQELLDRAVAAILERQQPNGSICTPNFGLDQYTTSISLLALKALNRPEDAPVIERAKQYLLGLQRPMNAQDPNSGGVGYSDSNRVDGSNTATWVEALKEAGHPADSEAFRNAQKFFSRLQNNKETNDLSAEGYEAGDDGGFFYRPGESKTDPEISRSGKKIPKSYGLMSYAGLQSFLYMEVGKEDPRVQSARRWVRDNFTLEENRNIGARGLYYYYLTMAKALAVNGEALIETSDGRTRAWASELTQRLLHLQRPDGSWLNDQSPDWKESDQVMVTAFAIRTLTVCYEFMKQHPLPQHEEFLRRAAEEKRSEKP